MRYSLNLPNPSLLLLLTSCLSQAVAASASVPTTQAPDRILHAATKRSDLYRRSTRITKKFETSLSYIEVENVWSGKSTFASQVRVVSDKPVLNLEEIEHHLKDVACGDGKMRLDFVDASSARDAFFSCRSENGGLIISSHESCNAQGERAVYRVGDVNLADDGSSLDISVTQTLWQDAFDRVDISFGDTTEDHLFRRHADFAKLRNKRQDITIPADIPEEKNTASFDLSSQLLDTVFPGEAFLAGLRQIVPIPQLPIEIGCKNCTTTGKIALSQGAFKIDLSQIDLIPDIFQGGDDGKEISKVVSGGFLELSANGVGAHIDLFARVKASGNYEIALFSIPIVGFTIPGIGRAGATFEPRIAADFDISGIEINYGFDVVIPDDSKIRLQLTDLSKSSISGFPGSTLTPLPFRTNTTDLNILLGVAFKPFIPVGFDFLGKLTAEAFVSMNLPRLDARLAANKPQNCGNAVNRTLPSGGPANTTIPTGNIIELGPIALVEANISVAADAGFSINIPLLPPPFNNVGLEANLFEVVIPLITACAKPEDAFMDAAAIVPAPASLTYTNASIKASATPTANVAVEWNMTSVVHPTLTPAASGVAVKEQSAQVSHGLNAMGVVYAAVTPAPTVVVVAEKPYATAQSELVSAANCSTSSKLVHGVSSPHTVTSLYAVPTPYEASSAHVVYSAHTIPSARPIPSVYGAAPADAAALAHAVSSAYEASSVHVAAAPTHSIVLVAQNATTIASGAQYVATPSAFSVARLAVLATGSLLPANSSGVPTKQPTPQQFTGAAVPGAEVPALRLGAWAWQAGVLGMSMLFGAMML